MIDFKEALSSHIPGLVGGAPPLAISCVLFDHCERLCDGLGKCVPAFSALVAEAFALLEVCRILHIQGVLDVMIASDLDPPWEVAADVPKNWYNLFY